MKWVRYYHEGQTPPYGIAMKYHDCAIHNHRQVYFRLPCVHFKMRFNAKPLSLSSAGLKIGRVIIKFYPKFEMYIEKDYLNG